MRPIRLLAPGPLDQRTGGYRYDRRIVEALRAAGRSARLEGLGGAFPEPDTRALAALRRALADLGDALPVVDHLAAGALGLLEAAAVPAPGPVLLVHHPFVDDPDLDADVRERLAAAEHAALGRAAGVIATSRFSAHRLADLGVDPAHLRVVEPGVDAAPAAPGSRDGPVQLLCIGAIAPRKGHDVLVEALGQIGARDWRCRCVGGRRGAPGWARRIDARAHELGVARRIEWAGELDEARLEAAWREADALVVPSRYEGYGMVVAEALARGLPVVATTGGALADTLPADCGWRVPPGDARALARALAELIDRPGRRATRARAARRAGAALPDWETQAAAFARAVDELAAPLAREA